MDYPLVSIITPTTKDREAMNERIRQIIQSQDYIGGIEHLFDYWPNNIGRKRNHLCNNSKGSIIIHADSDDIYAPDWITKSVQHLIESKADITGLSSAYFYKEPDILEYKYRGSQPYVLEGTMCYWRKTWENKPFPDLHTGEGLKFQANRKVSPHGYKTGFLAVMHDSNTASTQRMNIYTKTDLKASELYPFANL